MTYDRRRRGCGLCAVRVVHREGEPDHRDVFLGDRQQAEGDRIRVGVSRGAGGGITVGTGPRPDPARVTVR